VFIFQLPAMNFFLAIFTLRIVDFDRAFGYAIEL